MQPKAQIYSPEVLVPSEDINDAEVLHDHHAGEVDERNVRLVAELLPHLPGAAELLRRNMNEEVSPRIRACQDSVDKALGPVPDAEEEGALAYCSCLGLHTRPGAKPITHRGNEEEDEWDS